MKIPFYERDGVRYKDGDRVRFRLPDSDDFLTGTVVRHKKLWIECDDDGLVVDEDWPITELSKIT